jgi:predicted MFS family arabinose efflux permease
MQATGHSHQMSDDAGLDCATVAAIVYATSIAIIMLNVAPAAEPYLRQVVHLSSGEVGAVFSVELAAMGLASIPAYLWLGKVDASRVARCAYAAFILGNVLSSIHLASFALYSATRAVTGFGAGTLMVLGMSMAARTHNPDRLYALITFGQLASGAVMLWLLSGLARDGRWLHDLFHASAWLGVLGFMAAGPLSRAGNREYPAAHTRPPARSTAWTATLLVIAFAMVFNLVVGGLWSFVAEYAGAGTTPARVALVLAWATAAGLAGAASAFLIGNPWTRRRLLIAGYLGILLGSGLLQFARGPVGFAAGCVVLSLAWNFCVPSVFAAVAGQDPTGRLMSAANLAFAFGLALGPLLAGVVIESLGLDALFPSALAGLALGAVLTLYVTRAPAA